MRHRWYGFPQINTRLPRDQFRAVQAEARRRGIPASHVLKALVAAWYRNGIDTASRAQIGDLNCAANAAHEAASCPLTIADALQEAMRGSTRAVGPTLTDRDIGLGQAVKSIPSRLARSPGIADVLVSTNGAKASCGDAPRYRD